LTCSNHIICMQKAPLTFATHCRSSVLWVLINLSDFCTTSNELLLVPFCSFLLQNGCVLSSCTASWSLLRSKVCVLVLIHANLLDIYCLTLFIVSVSFYIHTSQVSTMLRWHYSHLPSDACFLNQNSFGSLITCNTNWTKKKESTYGWSVWSKSKTWDFSKSELY
jgi:hypothetical protein